MALTYIKGQSKIRPNLFQRFETTDTDLPEALDGSVGVVIRSGWGDTDKVTKLTSISQIENKFGTDGTTDIIRKVFEAGATTVYGVRLTSEDAKAPTATINATGGTIELALAYVGERPVQIQVKQDLTVDDKKNIFILEDGAILENLFFYTGEDEDEIDNFVEALNGSKYVVVTDVYKQKRKLTVGKTTDTPKETVDGVSATVKTSNNQIVVTFSGLEDKYTPAIQLKAQNGSILAFSEKGISKEEDKDTVTITFNENAPANGTFTLNVRVQDNNDKSYKTILESKFEVDVKDLTDVNTVIPDLATIDFTGGVSPTITNASYSNAFEKLERYNFNTLAIDTIDESTKTLAHEFIDRLYENGRYSILVLGTNPRDALTKMISEARSINSRNVVLVGPGYIDQNGNEINGASIAAQIAGLIAATSSKVSITKKALTSAVSLYRVFSNDEYEDAILGGLLTLSLNNQDDVVVEAGITTLTTLKKGVEDQGWKKIKRVKTRNELFKRVSDNLDGVGPDTPANGDGDAFLKGKIMDAIDEMISEQKLAPDYSVDITDEIVEPDSISFKIVTYDYDTREKIYLDYVFRYRED